MPGGGGILSAAIEHSANPAEPIEALGLTRRLMELYSNRLYLELAFHGNSAEKLVNRGLVALAQRTELPLLATGGVRFARPEDALAHKFLEATGRGTRAEGVLGHNGRDGYDLPTITVESAGVSHRQKCGRAPPKKSAPSARAGSPIWCCSRTRSAASARSARF